MSAVADQHAQPTIVVISDSLGETAELVARAAASQFNGQQSIIRRIPYVDTRQAIDEALDRVPPGSVVVYTIILPELRQYLREEAERRQIEAVDLMGPVMDALQRVTHLKPKLEPGIIHRLDEAYFRRMAAIEFAVKYDDGKDPRGLSRADLVLVGVSRTSKTPVSMYLAHRRYLVANVPLVPEVEPPEELFRVPPNKIVGLAIRPEKLHEIRQERLRTLGLAADASYGDIARIHEELQYAREIFRRLGCPVVDVSNKAIEETANRVLELMGRTGNVPLKEEQ